MTPTFESLTIRTVSQTPKQNVGARVAPGIFKRIQRVAAVDRRTSSNVVEILIERGLPEIEREVLGGAAPAPREATEAGK